MNAYLNAILEFRTNRMRDYERHGTDINRPPDQWSEGHNAVLQVRTQREAHWDDTLTYYCSAPVAKSVVDGAVWLTDVHQMNDTSELHFAVSHLARGLASLEKAHGHDPIMDRMLYSANHWIGNGQIWDGTRRYGDKLIMGVCFTRLADDVPMWDRYGSEGRGAAIHFNRSSLRTVIGSSAVFNPNSHAWEAGLARVCYDAPSCDCLVRMYEDTRETLTKVQNSAETQLIAFLLVSDILYYLVSHKDPRYRNEGEYRWFSTVTTNNTWGGANAWDLHDDGNRRFHFKSITWPAWCIGSTPTEFSAQLIAGVTTGPCISSMDEQGIIEALDRRGIRHLAHRSTAPMRCR